MKAGWITALLLCAASGVGAAAELRWGEIRLESEAEVDSSAWDDLLSLPGRPLESAPLDRAILAGLHSLARRGFPFASAMPGEFEVVGDSVQGRVLIDPGSRASIETVVLEGARVTRVGTALRLADLRAGDPYTGEEERRLRERLSRSGLFQSVGEVEVLPGSAAERVQLKVPVTEPPYTRFSGVLGVGGGETGLTGLLDLDLRNIAGTAREAATRWEDRGDGLTRFSLRYREPWLPWVPVGVRGALIHDVNQSSYSFTEWEIAGELSLGGTLRIQLGRGGSRAVEPAPRSTRRTEDFTVAGVDLDRRDSALLPRSGYRLALSHRRGTQDIDRGADSLRTRIDRTRWVAEAEGYRRFGRRWMAAAVARFQFLQTPEDSVPRWDLFAIGGAATLRGYREEQFLTPGSTVLQLEWRWLADDRGSSLYGFTDLGALSPPEGRSLRDSFTRFVLGTGVGVRQASRLGILGVEYGIAKGESPLDGRVHLRIDAVF